MRSVLTAVVAVVVLGPLFGCGGASERGKNQDLDRPQTIGTRR